MDNNTSIYGEHKPELEKLLNSILLQVSEIREEMKSQLGIDPVEHCLGRIKSEDSMREKCVRKNLPVTIRDYIVNSGRYEIIEEKDYINTAKPNGYRSYHMILRVGGKYHAEIQLRTISMDTWAALEHHLKYKKKIGARQKLIEEELKRCADELASTDLSMQTIRDMILEGDN